ncbi:MAG: hypothetical protein HOM71_05110, partial [Deltaproteobacteria bacterium]|nr:hypothetical protein [Deltaproteobacteria bacterium]
MNTQLQIITWKYLFGGGVLGVIFSSILIMIILHLVSTNKQHQRKLSLRDQHTEQVSRLGGISLYWGFLGALILLWWLPIEQQSFGLKFLPQNRLAGLCFGGLLAWGLGFADDIVDIRTRSKLAGQLVIS